MFPYLNKIGNQMKKLLGLDKRRCEEPNLPPEGQNYPPVDKSDSKDSSPLASESLSGDLGVPIVTEHSGLWRNEKVPRLIRWLVPPLICINLVLFVYGHIGVAITIYSSGTIFGVNLENKDYLQYSMITSIQKLFNEGAVVLAVVTCALSIIFPYVKSIMLVICWTTPSRILGLKYRRNILEVLDACGKLSLIELFVFGIVISTLTISIGSPEKSIIFLPKNLYDFSLKVMPGNGIYGFIAALIVSIGVTSVMATCNAVIEENEALQKQSLKSNETLIVMDAIHCIESKKPRTVHFPCPMLLHVPSPMILHFLLIGFAVISLALLILAVSVKFVQIEIVGVVGALLGIGGGDTMTSFSVLTLASNLLKPGFSALNVIIMLICVISIVLFPIAQHLIFGFFAWPRTRLSLKQALTLRHVHECISAFCGFEIFIVALCLSILEVNHTSTSLLEGECTILESVLVNLLLPMGFVSQRTAQVTCMQVMTTMLDFALYSVVPFVFLSNALNVTFTYYMFPRFIFGASNIIGSDNAIHDC